MDRLPIIYIRGFAGAIAGIDEQVDDPFYGFNKGATHIRIGGDGDPRYYQFEGPLLRLITEFGYQLLVAGDQRLLLESGDGQLPAESIWVHRFYDSVATTFSAPKKVHLFQKPENWLHQHLSSGGFDIEHAANDLYDLIQLVLARTRAPKVNLIAHSMGGLIARCMIQKICQMPRQLPDRSTVQLKPANQIVEKLFTFGTPHGGIATEVDLANKAMEVFGPVGSDIFAPRKMYGYLTPDKEFGKDEAPDDWDPRAMPTEVFDVDDIFCLVGTDPSDYGPSRLAIGPQSDGLVRIENAYVQGAHRAFVFKSHSGSYGEVNSEEGYQNLQRFLFGRWAVGMEFAGLPGRAALRPGITWQADMRLAIRGLPVVVSEQQAAHWCPIILDQEITAHDDTPNAPVPIVSTFLLERDPPAEGSPPSAVGPLSRYVVTLRVYKTLQKGGSFDFSDHLEQVSDWADSLIVDVGVPAGGAGLGAWVGWNADVAGALDTVACMPTRLDLQPDGAGGLAAVVPLPDIALSLPIFGGTDAARGTASLRITVREREQAGSSDR